MKFNLILVLIALIFCATAVEATKTEQFVYVSRPVVKLLTIIDFIKKNFQKYSL
jgi:hypothetical protein